MPFRHQIDTTSRLTVRDRDSLPDRLPPPLAFRFPMNRVTRAVSAAFKHSGPQRARVPESAGTSTGRESRPAAPGGIERRVVKGRRISVFASRGARPWGDGPAHRL